MAYTSLRQNDINKQRRAISVATLNHVLKKVILVEEGVVGEIEQEVNLHELLDQSIVCRDCGPPGGLDTAYPGVDQLNGVVGDLVHIPCVEVDVKLTDRIWIMGEGRWRERGVVVPMIQGAASDERVHVRNGCVGEEQSRHAVGKGEHVRVFGVRSDRKLNQNVTLLDEAHDILDTSTLADAGDDGGNIGVGTGLDDVE